MECPVCLSDTHPRDVFRPFDCLSTTKHGLCETCVRELWTRGMQTCPVCRAPATAVENSKGRVLMGAVQQLADHLRALLHLLPVDPETNAMLNEPREVVALARAFSNQTNMHPRDFQRRLQSLDSIASR